MTGTARRDGEIASLNHRASIVRQDLESTLVHFVPLLSAMMKQRSAKALAASVIASPATLGNLFPTSIMPIILAGQIVPGVGDLFMATLCPGLIIGGLYIGYFRSATFLCPVARAAHVILGA